MLRQHSILEIQVFLERALHQLTGEPLSIAIDGLDFRDIAGATTAELRLVVRSAST